MRIYNLGISDSYRELKYDYAHAEIWLAHFPLICTLACASLLVRLLLFDKEVAESLAQEFQQKMEISLVL